MDPLNERPLIPYIRAKTLAERAAWEFMERDASGLELSVINPADVFGPMLGPKLATTLLVVKKILERKMPGCPRSSFLIVDVRDVAELHLLAMTHPAAAGQRFLAVSGEPWRCVEIARMLKAHFGSRIPRIPERELPDVLIRVASLWEPALKLLLPELGRSKRADSTKARELLGWQPRSAEAALLATARSLIEQGLLD